MPPKSSGRRIVIIILFFLAHATILTLLGLGGAVAYARIPPPTDTPTDLADLRGRVDLQGRQEHPKPATAWIIPITVELFPPIGVVSDYAGGDRVECSQKGQN